MSTIDTHAGASLDPVFLEQWSQQWLEAWNEHDVEAIVSLCTADVTMDEPGLPETLRGQEGMRRFGELSFRTFPDVRIEELEPPYISATRPQALAPYRFVATMRGAWEPLGIAATGATVDFRGIDEWEFRGELLCRCATHYDSLDLARQMGVLPPRGSAADRLFARVQHLQARFQRRAHARSAR
jgi:steroid delta-isomerase-like uncharacterized protein